MKNMDIFVFILCFQIVFPQDPQESDYKWGQVVQEKFETVSESCLWEFQVCYNPNNRIWKNKLLQSLFEDPDERSALCNAAIEDGNRCPTQTNIKCDSNEYLSTLENFICYRFNLSDLVTPPVSTKCAVKYLACSMVDGRSFHRLLVSMLLQDKVCEEKERFMKCLNRDSEYCDFDGIRSVICSGGSHDVSLWPAGDVYNRCEQSTAAYCYGQVFGDLFEKILELRHTKEPSYTCGRLVECLLKPAVFMLVERFMLKTPWVACTTLEAEVADRTMCSDTTFTPDVFGMSALSEKCNASFHECYGKTLSNLLPNDHEEARRSLSKPVCKSASSRSNLSRCIVSEWSNSCSLNDYDNYAISDFLCYNPGDEILQISLVCRTVLNSCLGNGIQDVSYLEQTPPPSPPSMTKEDFCLDSLALTTCMSDWDVEPWTCSDKELEYTVNYLCSSPRLTTDTLVLAVSIIITLSRLG